MTKDIDPDMVTPYERDTWARCAESYLDTFAALTRETVPLLTKAALIGGGTVVLYRRSVSNDQRRSVYCKPVGAEFAGAAATRAILTGWPRSFVPPPWPHRRLVGAP
jgi:hypothetical protein